MQLGLVEFAVPLVQIAGSIVFFLGILFVFNQVNIFIVIFGIISLTFTPTLDACILDSRLNFTSASGCKYSIVLY